MRYVKISGTLALVSAALALTIAIVCRTQANPTTKPARPEFIASIGVELHSEAMNQKGVAAGDVEDALARFYKTREHREFTLDELGRLPIPSSAASALGTTTPLVDLAKISVTFSQVEGGRKPQRGKE